MDELSLQEFTEIVQGLNLLLWESCIEDADKALRVLTCALAALIDTYAISAGKDGAAFRQEYAAILAKNVTVQ